MFNPNPKKVVSNNTNRAAPPVQESVMGNYSRGALRTSAGNKVLRQPQAKAIANSMSNRQDPKVVSSQQNDYRRALERQMGQFNNRAGY